MLRQVMIPSKDNSTFSLPTEFYGKEVEILVFPFFNIKSKQDSGSINEVFEKYLYSFEDYKFDRDEANNYLS